ncbi:MAG: hypothetical protein V3W19_08535 [Desulfatiglandales bacterium]
MPGRGAVNAQFNRRMQRRARARAELGGCGCMVIFMIFIPVWWWILG